MEFVRVYDMLTEARRRLFDWVRPLSQEPYTRKFPFGLGTLRATLIEIALVEHMYALRLRGEQVPAPEDRPVSERLQPTFGDLERWWTAQARDTRATLAGITDWNATVTRRVEHPDKIVVQTATKTDLATQLLMHEVHHRAQAMAMLRQLGVEAANLDYIGFAATREEFPKDSAPRR